MTKQLVILMTCLLSAVPSFASKARVLALGQGENGSAYIDDPRVIFLNPAELYRFSDFANFEFGGSTVPSTPNAEGGFFHSIKGFRGGLQLGRKTDATLQIATINTLMGTALISPQNTVEAMLAGDLGNGLKWGGSLIYGSAERDTDIPAGAASAYPNKKANTLEVHGGVDHTDWHAYANIGLMSKSTNETAAGVTAQYQGKPSVRLGGAYNLPDDQKVYGQLTYANFTGNTGAASVADREATNTILNVGYVRFLMPENATHLFYTAGLTFNNFKLTNTAAAGDTQSNRLFIPFVLGLESDVNDWWTWRASVTQNLLLDQTKTASVTNSNDPNSTVVAAGTGFKWKKLVLDATLASATTGNIDGNNLMANAGLTYIF